MWLASSTYITVRSFGGIPTKLLRKILFLRVAERPNLIALDSLAGKIAKRLVLIFGTYAAHIL
jgi:hypothetical protein